MKQKAKFFEPHPSIANFIALSRKFFWEAYENITLDIEKEGYLDGLTTQDVIIELGGGEGWLTLKLSSLTPAHFFFIEKNPYMLELAHKNFEEAGILERVRLIQSEVEKVELEEGIASFIFSRGSLQFMDWKKVFSKTIFWLKKEKKALLGGGFGRQARRDYLNFLKDNLGDIIEGNNNQMLEIICQSPDFLLPYLIKKEIEYYKFINWNGYFVELKK